MVNKIIIACLLLTLFLLFVTYFKYVKMKQHFYLLEVSCVYALYTINNKDNKLDVALIMTILNLFKISLENHYLEEICIYLDMLDKDISQLRTIENMNNVVFNQKHDR